MPEAVPTPFSFRCRCCFEDHDGVPSFEADTPLAYDALAPDQQVLAKLTTDQCIIDGRRFFVRACLPIPVHGLSETFVWGVWCAIDGRDFERINAHWNVVGRECLPPVPARLATRLPTYPDTLGLEVMLQTQPVGERPLVHAQASSHPLTVAQRAGIPQADLQAIIEAVLHPEGPDGIANAVFESYLTHLGEPDDRHPFDTHLPPLEVLAWRGVAGGVTTLVTSGMATRPMPGPFGVRAELHWEFRRTQGPADERAAATFLAHLALLPWKSDEQLDWWLTVEIPGLIPGFPHCSALLFTPGVGDAPRDRVELDGERVHVLRVVPITADEFELASLRVRDLLDHWVKTRVDLLVDRPARLM